MGGIIVLITEEFLVFIIEMQENSKKLNQMFASINEEVLPEAREDEPDSQPKAGSNPENKKQPNKRTNSNTKSSATTKKRTSKAVNPKM
jgi:hypothetical protein